MVLRCSVILPSSHIAARSLGSASPVADHGSACHGEPPMRLRCRSGRCRRRLTWGMGQRRGRRFRIRVRPWVWRLRSRCASAEAFAEDARDWHPPTSNLFLAQPQAVPGLGVCLDAVVLGAACARYYAVLEPAMLPGAD
eukprot:1923984-Prymnesium_polylepis.1